MSLYAISTLTLTLINQEIANKSLKKDSSRLARVPSSLSLASLNSLLNEALYAEEQARVLIIFSRTQESEQQVIIKFSANFKWVSVVLVLASFLLSFLGLATLSLLGFTAFIIWVSTCLYFTRSVRNEIKEKAVLNKVKQSGSNWSYKNPITYTIS